MAQRSGSKAALHTDSSRRKAELLQAPAPASPVEVEEALLSPCTSVSSSSSLSSLDEDGEATLLAAAQGRSAPDILQRARLLVSALLLPVTVLAGYRPIGRQWRLAKPGQPTGVAATVSMRLSLRLLPHTGLSQLSSTGSLCRGHMQRSRASMSATACSFHQAWWLAQRKRRFHNC